MRGSSETVSSAVMPALGGPSPPTTPRIQCRVKRTHLRRVRPGQCEQTSDSTSSYGVSVRSGRISSGQAISSDASSSTALSKGRSVPQPQRLLTRRVRCETPVPRDDVDQPSDVDDDNNINRNTEEHRYQKRLETMGMVVNELLNDRLPLIDRRPVSRHVVYSLQYDDKMKGDDNMKSLFERINSTTTTSTSLVDSPRSLRHEVRETRTLERQSSSFSLPLPSQHYKDPSPNLVRSTRLISNDKFINQSKKKRILSWLESVEIALLEESIDTNTLSVIKEE